MNNPSKNKEENEQRNDFALANNTQSLVKSQQIE